MWSWIQNYFTLFCFFFSFFKKLQCIFTRRAVTFGMFRSFRSVWGNKLWQCSPHCHLRSGCVHFTEQGWLATGPGSISAGVPDVSITGTDRLIRQDWLPPPHVRKLTGLHQVPDVWGRLMKSHGGGSRWAIVSVIFHYDLCCKRKSGWWPTNSATATWWVRYIMRENKYINNFPNNQMIS